MNTKIVAAAAGAMLLLATPLSALAENTVSNANEISRLQQEITVLQKVLKDLLSKKSTPTVGVRLVSTTLASPIASFQWIIDRAAIPVDSVDTGEQVVWAYLTLKNATTPRYKVGRAAHNCTIEKDWPTLPEKNVAGFVKCSDTTFTAYFDHGKFFVERSDNGGAQKSTALAL